ncbi:MAG: translation initiation factor eIF-1A [Candidatus Diapherotrites archaeon]|nr:translation initiation factor eIF-1A [Candidatus Diapherotrites archaeon]
MADEEHPESIEVVAETPDGVPSYRFRYPNEKELEMFAVITQILGVNKLRASCNDGKERLIRIPGKLKKRVWVREGDLVIVKLWDFQPIKANLVWRYLPPAVMKLKGQGLLKNLPI